MEEETGGYSERIQVRCKSGAIARELQSSQVANLAHLYKTILKTVNWTQLYKNNLKSVRYLLYIFWSPSQTWWKDKI